MDEGGQKVQTFSFKINKYKSYNIHYIKYHMKNMKHVNVLYMKAVKRVNPKSSHHEEKIFLLLFFFIFYFIFICDK